MSKISEKETRSESNDSGRKSNLPVESNKNDNDNAILHLDESRNCSVDKKSITPVSNLEKSQEPLELKSFKRIDNEGSPNLGFNEDHKF